MKEDTGQILIVDKIVNNNIVIAKDFRGREVVAIGKGVGFRKRKNEAVHRSEIMKTLVTCTPYAVNTHRLLVRGYRIPYEEAVEKVPDEKIAIGLPFQMKVLFIGLFILFLILFFCGVAAYVKKRKKKREKTRREDHVSNEK